MSRYELLDEVDLPFPLGGCFGYWGYDLKNFVEPKLPRRAINDLELPDCHVGFYDSLVVFDHRLGKTWIVSTGWTPMARAANRTAADRSEQFWQKLLSAVTECQPDRASAPRHAHERPSASHSNLTRADFIAKVERVQRYIRAGDIYQVNLSQRLTAPLRTSPAGNYSNASRGLPRSVFGLSRLRRFPNRLFVARNFFCA